MLPALWAPEEENGSQGFYEGAYGDYDRIPESIGKHPRFYNLVQLGGRHEQKAIIAQLEAIRAQ